MPRFCPFYLSLGNTPEFKRHLTMSTGGHHEFFEGKVLLFLYYCSCCISYMGTNTEFSEPLIHQPCTTRNNNTFTTNWFTKRHPVLGTTF